MDIPNEANCTQAWVEGNAAAGILASVFALEMGAILRCPACAGVTLRIAATRHGCFIDMRGAEVVHFA